MSAPYHKIQSVYKRDPETKFKTFLFDQFSDPAFQYLQHAVWAGTEKVDGTNIRITWDGNSVWFGGRTNNAQIPCHLLEALQKHFTADMMAATLKGPITLYGEGYGPKIQKGGGRYRDDAFFIMFDAFAGMWLERNNVDDIAESLGIDSVPEVFSGTLGDAIRYCKNAPVSLISNDREYGMEGLVLRPKVELRNRNGSRIITKLKVKDFE